MTWWRKRKLSSDSVGELPVRISGVSGLSNRRQSVRELGYDQALLWVVVALLLWGLVMVYSASIALPDSRRFTDIQQTYFVMRHAVALGIGLAAGWVVFQIPVDVWERWAPHLFVFSLLLLLLVLVIGREVNGARRWISLGFLNFQPSELAKFAMILYASNYMVRKMEIKAHFWRAVTPIAMALLLTGSLLLAEPDMGAFLVIVVLAMGILFLGGVNARAFFLLAILMVAAFAAMIWLSPWRRERIFAYINPWDAAYALNKGYQLTHSLIALGRGQIWGVGLGGSVEKLHWLPEAHTDFLLAVIGEEFGLIGVVAITLAFLWITRRVMHIGRQALLLEREFAGLCAQGIALWIGFQAFINIGVNLGALPTKGLTLPLMSYGGSAVLLNLIALALVLRIDHENRRMTHGRRT